jgi:hypothetical protein
MKDSSIKILTSALLVTQKDYILQYVDCVDGLLEALLSREALADVASLCQHCGRGVCAVWRCKDCSGNPHVLPVDVGMSFRKPIPSDQALDRKLFSDSQFMGGRLICVHLASHQRTYM